MTNLSRRSIIVAFSIVAVAASFAPALAEDASHPGSRVALSGFDPVSYFTDGAPVQGNQSFSANFDDATYWFKNAEHQALFAANPDEYAPQYGGFCAISMSQGKKAEPDPHAWTISEGKLYVFRAQMGVEMFKQQGAAIAGAASVEWPQLKNSASASATN